MKRTTAWCLGFGAVLMFYLCVATFGEGFDWRRHYKLAVDPIQTNATVTAIDPKNHNTAHYSFEVDGKLYRSFGQGISGVNVDDKISIFYLREDPSFSTTTPVEDLVFMLVAPFVLSMLAGFGFMMSFGKSKTARKND